jgi:hypothetical protein
VTVGVPSDPDRQAILDALERNEVNYLVIGAAAAEALGWSGRSEDIDIVPETSKENLARLARALDELDASLIGDPAYPEGLPVPGGFDAYLLATKQVWNLMTPHGQLDITTHPSGTGGYTDLIHRASPQRSREPQRPSRSPAPPTSSPAKPRRDVRRTSRCCPRFGVSWHRGWTECDVGADGGR